LPFQLRAAETGASSAAPCTRSTPREARSGAALQGSVHTASSEQPL
jgi:hypothetical protein